MVHVGPTERWGCGELTRGPSPSRLGARRSGLGACCGQQEVSRKNHRPPLPELLLLDAAKETSGWRGACREGTWLEDGEHGRDGQDGPDLGRYEAEERRLAPAPKGSSNDRGQNQEREEEKEVRLEQQDGPEEAGRRRLAGTVEEGAPGVGGCKVQVEELSVHGGIHGRAAVFGSCYR